MAGDAAASLPRALRALIITNMYPTAARPGRGTFVRDQVHALARLPGVEVELFAFAPGGASPYPRAARELRRRYQGTDFDVIHAHFGLTAWPALALRGAPHVVTLHGTDLVHPVSRTVTLAALPFVDLAAPVSGSLAELVPRRLVGGRLAVLPCGVDLRRFGRGDRGECRRRLGLAVDRRYVLFPADPARPEKRVDRARALVAAVGGRGMRGGDRAAWGEAHPGEAAGGEAHPGEGDPGEGNGGKGDPGEGAGGKAHAGEGEVELLTLGHVDPADMMLWINAADAVVVTSERESFGLAAIEALACDVPVLSTDVGVAAEALAGVSGTYCGPFDAPEWASRLSEVLADPDPRVAGRAAAERYSADRMAERVLAAWRSLA